MMYEHPSRLQYNIHLDTLVFPISWLCLVYRKFTFRDLFLFLRSLHTESKILVQNFSTLKK